MTRAEIIKALKENTSAFGLMGKDGAERKELQDTAREIGTENFLVASGEESVRWGRLSKNSIIYSSFVYRLRADYQDEPEIVKCEIYVNRFEQLEFKYGESTYDLSFAVNIPEFSCFEYEGYGDSNLTRRIRNGKPALTPKYVVFAKENK